MVECLFRGLRWGILSLTLALLLVPRWVQAAVPTFEVWWVDPQIDLPRTKDAKPLGTYSWNAGPLKSSIQDARYNFAMDQVAIAGRQVHIGFIRASAAASSLEIRGKKLNPLSLKGPKDIIFYRTGPVQFILSNRRPIVFSLPERIDLDIDREGNLSLVDPEALIAELERQVLSYFHPAYFDQNFHYWFTGLGMVSNTLAEQVISHLRDRLLGEMRARIRTALRAPGLIPQVLAELRARLPIEVTKDFLGIRLRLDHWRLAPATTGRYAWRLRPLECAENFSTVAYDAFWKHISARPSNSVSLLMHQHAVSDLSEAYLRRLYRGDSDLAALPVDLQRHPQFPWLNIHLTETDRRGVVLYFMDYLSGLSLFNPYIVSFVAEGDATPEMVFWSAKNQNGSQSVNLDIRSTFVLSPGEGEPKSTPVGMTLTLEPDLSVRLAEMVPYTEQVQPVIAPSLFQLGAAFKGAVFKRVVSTRLNEALMRVRRGLSGVFDLEGVHLFGALTHPTLEVAGQSAEAVSIDFAMTAPVAR